ncbi:MAG: ATP-binding protein, partial [Candidatus Cloacimonetes bacterium]|nr:ATP-binding protein [Candidatus Cloacimonadota bacterium]
MLSQSTYEKLNQMNLNGFVEALRIQMSSNQYDDLLFEDRIGLIVDFEWTKRQSNKISRCIKEAHLRYP